MVKKKQKDPFFMYKGRNYEDSAMEAIRAAKSEAQYPKSAVNQGLKILNGERALYNFIVPDYLRRAHVPKALIEKLSKPGK